MFYEWKVKHVVVSCSAVVFPPSATSGAECLQDHMFVSNVRKNAELSCSSESTVWLCWASRISQEQNLPLRT